MEVNFENSIFNTLIFNTISIDKSEIIANFVSEEREVIPG